MTATAAATKKRREFDPIRYLATIAKGRTIVSFRKKQIVFAQGSPCDAVYYVQKGKIKLTVVSKNGREAMIGIMKSGDFFGEGCLTGQPVRVMSAIALEDCTLMRVENNALKEVLHQEHAFSDMFTTYLLSRNIRYEADLVDQLFNSSEKRLARILLLLAQYGRAGVAETTVVPKVTHETLAEMVGTTRSRVSVFMNKFRKLGFIEYGRELKVHSSLLSVVLHD
jgi:CRP/FNR family cyclic AMP-dependent transcriptional regulator